MLEQKQEAKKQSQRSTRDTDTATSSAAAAAAVTAAGAPMAVSNSPAAATPGGTHVAASASPAGAGPVDRVASATSLEGAKHGEKGGASPFACVSAIMGWDTFHMVHVLWIGLVDLPGKAPEKDWDLQVSL